METVHVLITGSLDEQDEKKIAAVAPNMEVTYAVEEVMAELGISPMIPYSRPVQRKLTQEEASKRLDRMLARTDIIFGWRLPRNLLQRAPQLKWVQGMAAGVDLLAGTTGLIQSDVIVTNASGTMAVAMAEFVFFLILMLAKQVRRLLANQAEHLWERYVGLELEGKTIGIIGLGHIGAEVASLARAFGMKVLAMRRSATRYEKDVDGGDELFPPGQLLQMLSQCDWVVLTVPLTSETRGLIGETQLRAMKPTAYIINVARGRVIKQDVLVRALKEGWIAGAGLDVFETEPLPSESELWGLPNVIISPHIAGSRERHSAVLTGLFCENLRRFLAGEKLLNLVDKSRGY